MIQRLIPELFSATCLATEMPGRPQCSRKWGGNGGLGTTLSDLGLSGRSAEATQISRNTRLRQLSRFVRSQSALPARNDADVRASFFRFTRIDLPNEKSSVATSTETTYGAWVYLHALRKATRSASSWGVSCWSRPAGMIETVLGRISSISRRAIRASWLTPVASISSSAVSPRSRPLYDLAVAGGHRDRLEAAHEAGAGKDDGLQEVAFGTGPCRCCVRSGPTFPPR